MQCPQCQQDNPVADAQFCPRCGAPAKHAERGTTPAVPYAELQREFIEAREQQTATSEILSVISSSPSDLEPVAHAIADSAFQLCDCAYTGVFRFDGELIHWVASRGVSAEQEQALRRVWPRPPGSETLTGRTILSKQTLHVDDAAADPTYAVSAERPLDPGATTALAIRSFLGVPMLKDGQPVGAISLARVEVRPFSTREIALIQTFADQAVIAIENVRLFTELQDKNRALTSAHAQVTESLEQQTATSEILRAISGAQTDVQPVFDAIARSAVRLCEAARCSVWRPEGETFRCVARWEMTPEGPVVRSAVRSTQTDTLEADSLPGTVLREGQILQINDVPENPTVPPKYQEMARIGGYRSLMAVPMVHEGFAVGVIAVVRPTSVEFTPQQVELVKTFADQAVIAIENVRLFTELQEKNQALTQAHAQVTESLEQQTATSDILRVISGSRTDVQPVFEAIVRSAMRLLRGDSGSLTRIDGDQLALAASTSTGAEGDAAVRAGFPQSLAADGVHPLTVRDRAPLNIAESLTDPRVSERGRVIARARGYHSQATVPMLRRGDPIGTISVARREPGGFTDAEIALLKTFADQAVIAIENVRLFTELGERNRDLTATGDILQVIASSPTNTQPVFDAIARNAVTLCGGIAALVLRFDGEMLRVAGHHAMSPEGVELNERTFPRRPGRDYPSGRAFLDRSVVHIPDLQAASEFATSSARQRGAGSLLAVPLLQEGEAIGVIGLARIAAGPFSPQQIEMFQTFAAQAVIAIENVRLFTELQTSNRELTTALDTQTATSDILRVISRSQTDVQPVFDAIVVSAVRLLRGHTGALTRVIGDEIHRAAHTFTSGFEDPTVRTAFPRSLHAEGTHAQAIRERVPVNIADQQTDPALSEERRAIARALGHRSLVAVPLLRRGEAIGTIGVTRREAGGFTDDEIALLQTFADQAVIAIENVRLFKELEERNRALTVAHAQVTESLEQQTATAEILRVISQSPTDVQPVFDAIVDNAVRLCDGAWADAYRFDGERQHFVACSNLPPEGRALLQRLYPRAPDPEAVTGRAILDRAVIHVPDAHHDPRFAITRHVSSTVGRASRSVLAVPMLHHGEAVGVILVHRGEQPRPFSSAEIDLLKTFADQAVIAIENVRLFKELQARTAALTRSVEQLTALGDVGRAVSSTLDLETVLTTIVSRAVQLSGLDGGVVFEYDEAAEEFVQRAMTDTSGALAEARRTTRIRKGEGVLGRTAITLEPVQVPDIVLPAAYEGRLRETLIESGVRAILAVPMVREGQLIGCLAVTRNQPGDFPAETVELLRTFATQSALAIQNARLFHEIEDKGRQLEAASRHKSEFLANMSHELRTPLNAIIGFSEVLSERMFGDLNEKQGEYLKDIYASGQHLLSLINDILDLSKIEAGRMELEVAEFSLPAAIDNALILVRERASRRGIRLGSAIDDRVGMIPGDERKVKQVLLNLLSNALKFTPEGGRIDVRTTMNDGMAEISIADTGVGIAPEDQEAIFEEFRQVGTADKKVEGTGLGLALSRKFIELHGGRIWVRSQSGEGSTFTFTLPTS